jgi:endo-1,4-beta-xylanase
MGTRRNLVLLFSVLLLTVSCNKKEAKVEYLKDAFEGKFLIGTALNTEQTPSADSMENSVILNHFNSVVAENCMKSALIQPEEGVFEFKDADRFVNFGQENGMFIIGHTLVWHSQAPQWFFIDDNGNDVSRDVLILRMKTHISTIVSRYKGKVHGWDVVNEAFEDDGSWRKSKFYEIIGEDYIDLAFQFAHEADPGAELYYNDYNMAKPGRRASVINLIKNLKSKGIKIDGIGMQAHFTMTYPTLEEYEESIIMYSELGVPLMITEMDLTVLPFPDTNITAEISLNYEFRKEFDPYSEGLSDSLNNAFTQRYSDFFNLFLKYHDKFSRVTVWGVNDAQSWRNYWPIFGRTDYPLLFDRDNNPKPVVAKIIEAANTYKCK